MTVKENEVGKNLVVGSGGFDLSGFTELRVVLTPPSGVEITKLTADGVTAPAVPITVDVDDVPTTFLANEYWLYPSETGVLTPSSDEWFIRGEYVDGDPTDLAGDNSQFTVFPRGAD